MQKPVLSALNDAVFKLIFGDKRNTDILAAFLKSVLDLPEAEYDYLAIVDPYLKPEIPGGKTGVLDVKIHTAGGKVIDVEIQLAPSPQLPKRIAFYSAAMLREQIGRGGNYKDIQQVVSIVITGFTLLPEEPEYLNQYSIRNKESGAEFTDILKILILELTKLPVTDDAKPVWRWLQFLKAETEEELMELAARNPVLKKPVAVLMELSEDERARLLLESREKLRWDNEARIHGAYSEGQEQGSRQSRLEIAGKMKARGVSAEQIAEDTGLSLEEAAALFL